MYGDAKATFAIFKNPFMWNNVISKKNFDKYIIIYNK